MCGRPQPECTEVRHRLEGAERRLRDSDRRVADAEHRVKEAEHRLRNTDHRREEAERSGAAATKEADTLRERIAALQQQLAATETSHAGPLIQLGRFVGGGIHTRIGPHSTPAAHDTLHQTAGMIGALSQLTSSHVASHTAIVRDALQAERALHGASMEALSSQLGAALQAAQTRAADADTRAETYRAQAEAAETRLTTARQGAAKLLETAEKERAKEFTTSNDLRLQREKLEHLLQQANEDAALHKREAAFQERRVEHCLQFMGVEQTKACTAWWPKRGN